MQHIESVRRTKERTRGCNPSFCRPSSYTAMAGTSRGGCQVPTHFLVIIITIPIVTIFISEYIGCDVGFIKFLCLFASYVMIQHPRVYEQGRNRGLFGIKERETGGLVCSVWGHRAIKHLPPVSCPRLFCGPAKWTTPHAKPIYFNFALPSKKLMDIVPTRKITNYFLCLDFADNVSKVN